MSIKEQAAKGVIWSGLENLSLQAVSTLVFLLLARMLVPEDFGVVSLASSFILLLQLFLDQGFSTAIIQRDNLEKQHLDTAFWTNFALSLALIAAIALAARPLASIFNEPKLSIILICLSPIFLLEALQAVQRAILEKELRFKELAVRSFLATTVSGIVGVSMAFGGFGVWSLISHQLVNRLVGVLVLWKISTWRPKLRFSIKHFLELFNFGANILGIRVLIFLSTRSDNFLIGYFLGTAALGYYDIAYKIFTIVITLITNASQKVAFSAFSKIQKDEIKLQEAFLKSIKLVSLISFPIFLGLCVLAPKIIPVIFGVQWLPSVPVMQVLAFVGILQSVQAFNGTIINSVGKPSWNLRLVLLDATTNLAVFFITVHWGILAVALGYTIRGYLFSPIHIAVLNKVIHLQVYSYLKQFVPALLSSVSMTTGILALMFIFENYALIILPLAIYVLFGVVIYGFLIFLFEPKIVISLKNLASNLMLSRGSK